MLINGQPFEWDDWDQAWGDLLEALNELPSGFERRAPLIANRDFAEPSDTAIHYENAATQIAALWSRNPHDPTAINNTLAAIGECILQSRNEGEVLDEARYCDWYGLVCVQSGMSEQGLPYYKNALSLYQARECYPEQLHVLGGLHKAIRANIAEKESKGWPLEAIAELAKELKSVRQEILNVRLRVDDAGVEPEAFRVEQREVGFSDSEEIGTDNLQHCVCVIVRDPRPPHKTCVAHVDQTTSLASLDLIFKHMPESSPDYPLEVKLIGGRFGQQGSWPPLPGSKEGISKSNLQKVMDCFKDKNVDIVSAWVLDEHQPRALVVNPKTFEIREAHPWRHDRNSRLGDASLTTGGGSKPLHVAFDLTVSKQRAPILLTSEMVSGLYSEGMNDKERYAWFDRRVQMQMDEDDLAVAIEATAMMAEGHRESVAYLNKCLDERLKSLRTHRQFGPEGIEIDQEQVEKARKKFEKIAIHIGEGAEEANRALGKFIGEARGLVKAQKRMNGEFVANFDWNGLEKKWFREQPFDVIAAKSQPSVEQAETSRKRRPSATPEDGVGIKRR